MIVPNVLLFCLQEFQFQNVEKVTNILKAKRHFQYF